MNILFFDTETTGLVDWSQPVDHPGQPQVVQLGAILTDENLKERARVDLIVLPDVGEVPLRASDVNGITTEIAITYGVSNKAAALVFDDMMACSDRIVAHNAAYDVLVMRNSFMRAGLPTHGFDEVEIACTKLAATPLCRIPKPRMRHPGDWKWPTLDEAHRYFFDKSFEGAHSAIPDVLACMNVYREIVSMNALAPGLSPIKKEKAE
jgi:DNA polymerase III subunit epsilon